MRECDKEWGERERSQDASLWLTALYESLFTTDGSPFPWVFMLQWFIKEISNVCFYTPPHVGTLEPVTLRHESQAAIVAICWWHLKGIFLVGVDWLDDFFFPPFPFVTGEGRKGIAGIIWGGRRGPVIHNACYLTQHTDLLLIRTGLYLQHQCHHMTTVHDKALFARKMGSTQYNSHAAALDRTMDLAQA